MLTASADAGGLPEVYSSVSVSAEVIALGEQGNIPSRICPEQCRNQYSIVGPRSRSDTYGGMWNPILRSDSSIGERDRSRWSRFDVPLIHFAHPQLVEYLLADSLETDHCICLYHERILELNGSSWTDTDPHHSSSTT